MGGNCSDVRCPSGSASVGNGGKSKRSRLAANPDAPTHVLELLKEFEELEASIKEPDMSMWVSTPKSEADAAEMASQFANAMKFAAVQHIREAMLGAADAAVSARVSHMRRPSAPEPTTVQAASVPAASGPGRASALATGPPAVLNAARRKAQDGTGLFGTEAAQKALLRRGVKGEEVSNAIRKRATRARGSASSLSYTMMP